MEEKKKYLSLKELEETINLEEFTKDWCSDDGLDFPELCKKYNGSVRNLRRYAGSHKLRRSKTFINNKAIRTNLERYGVAYGLQNENIKNKIKQTNIEKYGVDNPMKNKEIKDKANQTNIIKYGVKNPSQDVEIRKKVKQTNIEKYGVEYFCQTDACKNASKGMHSKPNENFAQLLENKSIKYSREFPLKNRSYDFKINNMLVEIDPTYTHNSYFGFHNTNGLEKKYHKNKSELAKENNYNCVHVFDWDNQDKIVNMFYPKKSIYARQCKLKVVPDKDTNMFLNNYHLQNTCKGQKICLGLYYNDELVEIMTFGKPRYNKNYEYELLRLCFHPEFTIIGGSQKLFKYFISEYSPKSILSYCDNAKFNGHVYLSLGFSLLTPGVPTKHWYNVKTKQHITDNFLRQRGFDQIFDANFGKGTNNEDLMHEYGFVELYDCGQATYIWKRED